MGDSCILATMPDGTAAGHAGATDYAAPELWRILLRDLTASGRAIDSQGMFCFVTSSANPTPTHAQLLGEIIIEWSKVAPLLEALLSQLAGLDDPYVRPVLLGRIRDGQLDQVCRDLSRRLIPEQKQHVTDWLDLVKRARSKRNDYMHGVYLQSPQMGDGEVHIEVLGRDRLDHHNGTAEPRLTALTHADLTEFRDMVMEIQNKFAQFLNAPSHLGISMSSERLPDHPSSDDD